MFLKKYIYIFETSSVKSFMLEFRFWDFYIQRREGELRDGKGRDGEGRGVEGWGREGS